MHRFIPTHWNRNTHILVTKYNWPIEATLVGHAVIVHINHLDDILHINNHLPDATKIHCYVYTDPQASLETIDFNPAWGNLPIRMYIGRLGQFRNMSYKIGLMKNLNLSIIFTGPISQAATDAQILASLGIHTGIGFPPNQVLDDHVRDLITYSFYSIVNHADIEPFSSMERAYDGESYISPDIAQFIDPLRYVYVDKDLHIAFSQEELNQGQYFATGLEALYDISTSPAIEKASHNWQKWFIESHPCTFCPAFRVCQGYFCNQREKGDCKIVMNDLLEGIEFTKKKLSQCQQ